MITQKHPPDWATALAWKALGTDASRYDVESVAKHFAQVREQALDAAAMNCSGPDDGLLHGCHCRSAVLRLKQEAPK